MATFNRHYQCTAQYRRGIAPYKPAGNRPSLVEFEAKRFGKSAAGAPQFFKAGKPVTIAKTSTLARC